MSKVQASLRSQPKKTRRWHNWLALLCVIAAVFLLIKGYHAANPSPQQQDVIENSNLPSAVQYDFYTVLPKMLVTTPENSSVDAVSNFQYLLQIASFRSRSDAQHVCDQIQSYGLHAFIQEYKSNQTVWYRVVLGPYSSSSLAEHDQQQLKSHHISSMMLRTAR